MTTATDPHEATYAGRRERFNALLDEYECPAGSWSALGAGPKQSRKRAMRAVPCDRLRTDGPPENLAKLGRWALVTETRGFGHFVENIIDRADVERRAADCLEHESHPVCCVDLDVLAGAEPTIEEGDIVKYTHEGTAAQYHVVGTATKDGIDGEPYRQAYLHTDPDGDTLNNWTHLVDPWDLTVVQRGCPDRRPPARFSVAATHTIVVFNTVADR